MADEVVQISFIGDANFSDVVKQANLLQKQFEAIKASQMSINTDQAWRTLNTNIEKSGKLTQLYSGQMVSSTERLSESIAKGTLTVKQAWAQRKVFNSVIKEQIALQKSLATVTTDEKGVKTMQMWGVQADKLADSAVTMRSRLGTLSTAFKVSGNNMIKWGKDTQWAGRQMMVGLGVPIAALGYATGKLANDTDKEFTRIAKVYGDATTSVSVNLAKLRAEGTATYREAAKLYGMTASDTLDIQADLAAAGRTGNALQKQTLLVARAMTLGEANQADAMKGVIALQSVYHMNTKQIADSLNYMNAVENQTNLSFQDFITAIPRGAGLLANMGVTLRDLGPLLVAVKQSGIDAAQGMRGIASGAQSLLKIAPQTEKLYAQLTGDSLSETVDKNGGNFIKIINDMSDAMAGLQKYQRQQIISQVFGKFQSAKMVAVFDGLINKTNQVTNAMKVSDQTTSQWGDTADRELTVFQNSVSGKFKIAVAQLQDELIPVGDVFLKIATEGTKFFTAITKGFNAMPGWLKWVVAFGAGFIALTGALTMVTGVFANLLGHGIDFVGFIMGKWGRGTQFMTKQQKAVQLQLEMTSKAMQEGTDMINTQAEALTRVNKALQDYLVNLAGASNNPGMGLRNANASAIQQMVSGGNAGVPYVPRHAKDPGLPETAQDSKAIAEEMAATEARSKRIKINLAGAAGALAQFGMGAIAVNNMQSGSQSLLDNVINVSLLLGSVGPLLARGLRKVKWSVITNGISEAVASSKVVSAASGMIGRIGTAMKSGIMAALTSPYTALIAASLAAVAVGVYAIYKHQQKVLNEQTDINNQTDAWAKSLGGSEKSVNNIATGMRKTKQDMSAATFTKQVTDLTKANSLLVNNIREMADGSQDLQNQLATFALRLSNSGLTNKQIQQQLKVLLTAGGRSTLRQQDILVHLNKVDFDNPKEVSKLFWDSFYKATKTLHPGFAGEFTSQDYSAMKAQGEQMGQAYADSNAAARKKILEQLIQWEDNIQQKSFDKLRQQYSAQFQQLGITSVKQMNSSVLGQLNGLGVPREALESWKTTGAIINTVTEGFKEQLPASEDAKNQIKSLSDVNRVLYGITMSVAQAQKAYTDALDAATASGKAMTYAQNLNLLNEYRRNAGLAKTTDLEDGFGKVTRDATAAVKDQAVAQNDAATSATDFSSALGQVNSAMRNQVTSAKMAQDLLDAYKTAMQNAQDRMLQAADDALGKQEQQEKTHLDHRHQMESDALAREQNAQTDALTKENNAMKAKFDARNKMLQDQATKRQRILDSEHQKELDALKKQQEAEDNVLEHQQNVEDNNLEKRQRAQTKALDDTQKQRRDHVSKYYNTQIREVNAEIKAEQNAEKVRQAIFDAEQTRIQRAAQMANTNIDFNVAVDTGQLDEAAKIMNDSQAQHQAWANQDSADSAQSASDKRIAGLQKEIDEYKKQRDARIKTLDQMDKAEKKRLEDQQKREKKALDERQKREKKAQDDAQKAQTENLKKRQRREDNAERDYEKAQQRALKAEEDRWAKAYAAAKKNLDRTQQQAKRDLDREQTQQNTALDNMQKNRRQHIDDEINVLKNSIPRTAKQYREQEHTVLGIYDEYGVKIKKKGSNWSQTIADGLNNAIHGAAIAIQNDQEWATFSRNILKQATKGVGMSVSQFMKFAQTGKLPKSWKMPKKHDTTGSRVPTPDIPGSGTYHGGGLVGPGAGSGRAGMTGNIKPNERVILAKDREFVVNDKAAKKIGYDNLSAMNKTGQLPMGGPDIGVGGLAAVPTIMMGAAIAQGINQGVARTFDRQVSSRYLVSKGIFGDSGTMLDAERARNASAVIDAGKKMGATNRDIIIALMTALQESGLHNYKEAVDHDSLGIFQQRASWGSVAERTDPSWAAMAFYKKLLSIKDRGKMSLGQAAQEVQVSAFPGAYAQWQDEARQIFASARMIAAGGAAGQKPGDYQREQFRGVTLDERTVRMIHAAEAMGWPTGRMMLYQGSFSNSVSASAGTHSGGGAMDVAIDGMSQRQQDRAVEILRDVGFAAWERHPWEGFVPHIHAIAIGDKLMSHAAAQQVVAYRHHRDGLADNGPDTWPDVRGGAREGVASTGGILPTVGKFKKVNLGKPGKFTNPVPQSLGVSRAWHQHENRPRATDVAAHEGAAVKAVNSGLVVKSADMRGFNSMNDTPFSAYGKYIVVDHGNGMQTLYAHLSERDARVGQMVKAGALIGRVGHTGSATGSHLHLETWWNGKSVPPDMLGIPGLKVGGEIRYDNTLANLHKGERVLTAPLSQKLESGIEKIDSGGGDQYNVTVYVTGQINSQIDFQRGVEDALETVERRKGPRRVID